MAKRTKARGARPAAKSTSKARTGISVRTSRIIFAVLAFAVILTMIIALAPAVAKAPS